MNRKQENIANHILSLSNNKIDFDMAKMEWELDEVILTISFGRCPCGMMIKERCYIKHKENGNKTYVGHFCARDFMGINANDIVFGLKTIQQNPLAQPNDALIEYAKEKGFLFDNHEYQRGEMGFIQRILENMIVQYLPNYIADPYRHDESESEHSGYSGELDELEDSGYSSDDIN